MSLISCFSGPAWAQWQEAPEKWSAPVKIVQVSDSIDIKRTSSLTADEKTMYLTIGSLIAVSHLSDNGWGIPVVLGPPINVPEELTENPFITADGRTLLFRRFRGAYWVLFESHWNDSLNNWGDVSDLGPNISDGGGNFGMIPDSGRHLVFQRSSLPLISRWNDTTQTWAWPQWVDMWKTLDVAGGLYMSRDMKKLYYDSYDGHDNNLFVHYYDTAWSQPMLLNLHAMLDTCANTDHQYQGFPWLSSDGRRLYFTSTHEGGAGIYMSKLLVDEHGDTLSTSIPESRTEPLNDELRQNWPNPFNGSTRISFRLGRSGPVRFSLFDILGQKVYEKSLPFATKGDHAFTFENSFLASGLYLYSITTVSSILTRKMVILK